MRELATLEGLWRHLQACADPSFRQAAIAEALQGDDGPELGERLVLALDDPALTTDDGMPLRELVQGAVRAGGLGYAAIEHLYAAAVLHGDEVLRECVLGLHHGPATARDQAQAANDLEPPEPPPDAPSRQGLAELLTALRALSELAQRIAVMGEWIARQGPEQVIKVLSAALHAVGEGQGDARLAIDVFHAFVAGEQLGYEQRARLYEEAVTLGARAVQRLVLAPPAREIDTRGKDPRGSLAALGQPLGMRTWLARRADRDLIDRLLLDPEPSVVSNLLLNPFLTERDVLRVASRRPARPEVLLQLSHAPRWNRRYAVRRALVFNPYTPVDLALRQVPFLKRADLRAVAADGKLHPEVRQSARQLARKRPPRAE